MKKLVRLAVNNPVTILMIVLAIGLLGKISYDKLSVDLLPDLNKLQRVCLHSEAHFW